MPDKHGCQYCRSGVARIQLFTSEQTRNSDASIVVFGWYAFRHEYRNPGRGGLLVKPVEIASSFGLDRLATWNEVICAISISTEGVLALGGAFNDLREMDSEYSASIYNLPENDMWLAAARQIPDSKSN
jgi:hypothetical protein